MLWGEAMTIDGPTGTFLTGLISINGEPVVHCEQKCNTHKCIRPCGRINQHLLDSLGHICNECANILAEVQD
jgi:hypothetical protein